MLFSAGLGIGLLFYGVAEPIGNLNDYPGMIEGNLSYNAGKALSLANLHWGSTWMGNIFCTWIMFCLFSPIIKIDHLELALYWIIC